MSPQKLSLPDSQFFPPPESASPEGIVAYGIPLTPTTILDALIRGIFPWTVNFCAEEDENDDYWDDAGEVLEDAEEASNEGVILDANYADLIYDSLPPRLKNARWEGRDYNSLPRVNPSDSIIAWWSPDPRAIFDLENIHVPKRLRRTMNSGKYSVTFDSAFPEVLLACATSGKRIDEGSWITKEFYAAYCKLFQLGVAHSVECWSFDNGQKRLAGGVYGVAANGFFDGESMFSVERDASKVALFTLLEKLARQNYRLFDLQVLNPHTEFLGGIEISRDDYLRRLSEALSVKAVFNE